MELTVGGTYQTGHAIPYKCKLNNMHDLSDWICPWGDAELKEMIFKRDNIAPDLLKLQSSQGIWENNAKATFLLLLSNMRLTLFPLYEFFVCCMTKGI